MRLWRSPTKEPVRAANAQLDAINTQLSQLSKQMDQYSTGQYGKYNDPKGYELKAQYDALMDQRANLGHMYEVNIGADPEHFLDWDKPLSEQSHIPAVQSLVPQAPDGVTRLPNGRWGTTLNGNVIGRPDGWPDMSTAQYVSKTMRDDLGNTSNWTGSDLHSYLAKNNPGAPAAPAEQMQAAGIPGIRYLDQGSRGAGQGTHNYVVFDANTIDILRKYGIAGLIAGGGAARHPATAAEPVSDTALHLHVHTGDRGPTRRRRSVT